MERQVGLRRNSAQETPQLTAGSFIFMPQNALLSYRCTPNSMADLFLEGPFAWQE
jgi:hypothetical protein